MPVRNHLDELRHKRQLSTSTPSNATTVSAGAILFTAIASRSPLSD
ncbi:MAG: hypothetical protein WBD25_12030 [Terriglobales bacterium]